MGEVDFLLQTQPGLISSYTISSSPISLDSGELPDLRECSKHIKSF
jgi:hypothetical protein